MVLIYSSEVLLSPVLLFIGVRNPHMSNKTVLQVDLGLSWVCLPHQVVCSVAVLFLSFTDFANSGTTAAVE